MIYILIHLGMATRISKMADEFKRHGTKSFPCTDKLLSNDGNNTPINSTLYRSLVMTMRYVSSLVKPGTLFHTTYLASKQAHPVQKNMDDAYHLLEYFNQTKDEKVIITAMGSRPILQVYSDASHGLYSDGKGQGGICVFIGECKAAIYNKSTKLPCTTTSSSDSEIVILSSGTLVGDFFMRFMLMFDVSCPIEYYEDNDSCSTLSQNGSTDYLHKKRYIINHINSIKEYLSDIDNNARIIRKATDEMTSDIHTKNLRGKRYHIHNAKITGNY